MKRPIRKLLTEIRGALGSSITPSLHAGSAGSDLFEAYIWALLIRAARLEGATVTYETVYNEQPVEFFFRTSPGHIYSTANPYTHAVLTFDGSPPLEAHVGIRVRGKSGVLHECDVAVLYEAEAQHCRISEADPRSSKVLLAIEAKFYSANLSLGLARAYLGLTSDLSVKEPCFVANISSVSVAKLLAARTRNWQDNVVPDSQGASRLLAFTQDVFHRYQAR